jgi:hypothetical protein
MMTKMRIQGVNWSSPTIPEEAPPAAFEEENMKTNPMGGPREGASEAGGDYHGKAAHGKAASARAWGLFRRPGCA